MSVSAHHSPAPALRLFDFNAHAVRIVDGTEGVWFLGADVCGVMGTRTSDLKKILDSDEVDSIHIANPGENGTGRQMLVISESGFYKLVLRSRKPVAKKFQKWVTAEVLPAIRRTGRFAVEDPFAGAEAAERTTVSAFVAGKETLTFEQFVAFGTLVRRLNQAMGVAYEYANDPELGKVRSYSLLVVEQAWQQFQARKSPFHQLELAFDSGAVHGTKLQTAGRDAA